MATDKKNIIVEEPETSTTTKTTSANNTLSAEQMASNKAMGDWYAQKAKEVSEKGAELAAAQQQQSDLSIKSLENQKTQMKEDYLKEQKAAYTDYQKEVNPYGINAEAMAANGMTNSGYNESSRIKAYNAYQARVATNKQTLDTAFANYDIAIAQAKAQNSSVLAQMALDTLSQEIALMETANAYYNANTSSVVDNQAVGAEATVSAPPSGYSATSEQQVYQLSDGSFAYAVIYTNGAGERMFYNAETGEWMKDQGVRQKPNPNTGGEKNIGVGAARGAALGALAAKKNMTTK